MAYIIDLYNKYDRFDREHSKYVFEMNEQEYAIKEVELDWGLPRLAPNIQKEINPNMYQVYATYEDAMRFAKYMRHLNL